MSTKTTFKRIALVAVASLGFGLLSVVPAKAATAAYTTVLGTVTPSVPTVGAAVTIPLKLTLGTATEDTAGAPTFTATFAQKPVNTSLVNTDLAANVTGSELATAGADKAVASAATNVITVTTPATDITAFTALLAGNYVFTPDQPGMYSVTITASAGTFTATTAIVINVGGAALTQSSSGKGAAVGNAIVNGSAVAAFTVRAGTAATTRFNVTSTGVGSVNNGIGCVDQSAVLVAAATAVRCSGAAVGTVATINGTNYAAGFSYTSGAAITSGALTGASKSEQFTFDASSSEIGTQTITITEIALATGIPTVRATVVINWVATTSSNASAQYSTAYMNAGTTLASSANDDTTAGVNCSRTAGTQCANILVTVKDTNNVALNQASISATITGPGLMGFAGDGATANTAASGRVVATSSSVVLTANAGVISVWPDGTSGTATITISSGTVVLATKTINFYGTVATLEATQNLKVARASAAGAELGCNDADCGWLGTAVSTPAVYIVAKDSAGQTVPGQTITALSNSPAVIISGSVTEDDATAGDGPGYYNASVTSAPNGASGASGTVVFRTLLSTGAYVSTGAITFTLGGSVATATLTLDKDSYQAGEAMVVTRTAKDSAGNPVYDGVASPAVVFSKAIGGTAPVAGEYRSGVSASSSSRPTVFAPSTGGAFEARATFSFAGVSTQVTASATVADDASTAAANAASDAASEAIDAANAATDAANLAAEAADAATVAAEEARDAADAATAAVEALATEVATLMAALKAQITTLANTVAKIAKKVKA